MKIRLQPLLFVLCSASAFICLMSLAYFALISAPIALQKILSMRVAYDSQKFQCLDYELAELADVKVQISQIPYKPKSRNVWDVQPFKKYQSTIEYGYGNCSNLAFGALYGFIKSGTKAYIVHLLRTDMEFLNGSGHTVVELLTKEGNVIVDYLEGGVPLRNGRTIDTNLDNLGSNDVYSSVSFNSRKDNINAYFNHDFLKNIEFGIIPQHEISEYFEFLDIIYVNFGMPYPEKLLYDTIALFFGKYPNTYVPNSLYEKLKETRQTEYVIAYLALYFFHLSYTFLMLYLVLNVTRVLKEKFAAS